MPPPWIAPGIEKNLDETKHDLKTSTRSAQALQVHPMGDFRYNDQARVRRLENLMGTVPKQEKNEIKNNDLNAEDRPLTDLETVELKRKHAQLIAKEARIVAFKRDGSAFADEDGYAAKEGPPAFRDGFNNTLRVKPNQEDHLHNGLKTLKLKTSISSESVAISARSNDQIHRLSRRPDIAAIIGNYFVNGISSTDIHGLKSRDVLKIKSLFRNEHSTDVLEGGGLEGVAQKSDDLPETEESRRQLTLITKALGNAFVNLGMTLPAGKRDDPLRNDSVALKLGNRIMSESAGIRTTDIPKIEESNRREVAIALGRAILHIKAAAGIEASRGQRSIIDSAHKDRTLKMAVGKLTLQLIEATASRSGKMVIKDQHRREVLANALGNAVFQMEAGTIRKQDTDRNKVELNVNIKNDGVYGPTLASKGVSFKPQKKDIIVNRPILPGRDAPPPSIERYKPIRG